MIWALGRVLVQVDLICHRDHFAIRILPARGANVMRTLQLATAGAFVGVRRNESIMRTAVVAPGFRNFVLLDSHVTTFASVGPVTYVCASRFGSGPVNSDARLLVGQAPCIQPLNWDERAKIPRKSVKASDSLPQIGVARGKPIRKTAHLPVTCAVLHRG